MTTTIYKEFTFDSSHQLKYLAETQPDHKCARLHGHTYTVRFFFTSHTLDSDGFVIDFTKLDPLKKAIDEKYDHRFLNEVLDSPDGRATTSEALAQHFYELACVLMPNSSVYLSAVEVQETAKTCARFAR